MVMNHKSDFMKVRGVFLSKIFSVNLIGSIVVLGMVLFLQLSASAQLPVKQGWPQDTSGFLRSSPAVAPLSVEGPNALFIGVIEREETRGSLFGWTVDGQPAFGEDPVAFETGGNIISSPAVADIDRDGDIEIIFGADDSNLYIFTIEPDGLTEPGLVGKSVISLSSKSGRPLSLMANTEDRNEPFLSPGLRKQIGLGDEIYSTPALGQLDEDEELEIVVASENGLVYALNPDGTAVEGQWPVQLPGLIRSSAAIGDIDGDGMNEVIIGCFDQNIYAFDATGTPLPGQWPVTTGGTITASPSLGDLDDDPGTLEVVIGSSDGSVYALRYDGSALNAAWPVQVVGFENGVRNDVDSSAALADLDNDGQLEIIVGSDGGYVHALNTDGSYLPGWPVATGGEVFSSPAVADLDLDGDLEIIVGADVGADTDIGNRSSRLLGLEIDGSPSSGFPISYDQYGEARLRSSPLVKDLDNDGILELVAAVYLIDEGAGKVFVYELTGEIPEDTGTIEGRVLDGITGEGVEGVTLTFQTLNLEPLGSVTTDENGIFSIELPPGDVRAEVARTGYVSTTLLATVIAGQTVIPDVILFAEEQPGLGGLEGRVVDQQTRQGIVGALIVLRKGAGVTSGSPAATGQTTLDGLFLFQELQPGTYTAEISADEYITRYLTVAVVGGQNLTVPDIALTTSTVQRVPSAQGDTTILFDELPIGTQITDQYGGITFGSRIDFSGSGLDVRGEIPFIVGDSANPGSPVLSGVPIFSGPLAGVFDEPQSEFEFEAGFFDTLNSTTVIVYAEDGTALQSTSNIRLGLEVFAFRTANDEKIIKGFEFLVSPLEQSGAAIDDFVFSGGSLPKGTGEETILGLNAAPGSSSSPSKKGALNGFDLPWPMFRQNQLRTGVGQELTPVPPTPTPTATLPVDTPTPMPTAPPNPIDPDCDGLISATFPPGLAPAGRTGTFSRF